MAETGTGAVLDEIDAVPVTTDGLDAALAEQAADRLTILFLWGITCPNCVIAKREIGLAPERFRWDAVRWLQCNVYEDEPMATRFGLHGIPFS